MNKFNTKCHKCSHYLDKNVMLTHRCLLDAIDEFKSKVVLTHYDGDKMSNDIKEVFIQNMEELENS